MDKDTNENVSRDNRLAPSQVALKPTLVRPESSRAAVARLVVTNGPRPENQFAHYWNVILDHKLLVSAAFFVPLILAVAVALLQSSRYRATTTIELMQMNQNFLNLNNVDPNAPLSASSDRGDSYTQTQLELLKRDALVERVVKSLKLDQDPKFTAVSSGLHFLHSGGVLNPVRIATARAQKDLRVQQRRQSNLVDVSFQSSDPKLAVNFVNTLAQQAMDENVEARSDLSRNVGIWLEQRLGDLRKKLYSSEQELEQYNAQNALVPLDDKSSSEQALIQQWEQQLAKVQTDRIHRESLYIMARSANADALPEVLDDAALKEYDIRLADLKRQQAELTASLTSDHPKVQRVTAQIADLESTIAQARSRILNRLQNEYTSAEQEERSMGAAFATQLSKASALAQKQIHYNTLKRELETTQNMYDDMLKRVNDAELGAAARTAAIRVVDTANAAEKEDLLQARMFIGGIGAFSGLLLAGLLVFVVDQCNTTIRAPGHMPALLNVPELGVIPAIKKKSSVFITAESRLAFEVLDSFHSAIRSILFALEDSNSNRLIIVSSPGPGEGKTTVTAHLGTVLADIGYRVLLIDADMRRAYLHKMFGISNGSGFSETLADSEPVTIEAVEPYLQRVFTPGKGSLDVMPAGACLRDPFSHVHASRAKELFDILRGRYDVILVDTPPVLLVPESRVIGRMADSCVLVFRAGKTTMNAATGAEQRMAADGIPLLGTILNDCPSRHAAYGAYGYYGDSAFRSANG